MPGRTPARSPRLHVPWQLNLGVLALIWGSSFLLIKVALAELGPVQVAAGRILLGALTLLAIVLLSGERLPRDRTTWLHAAIAGLVMNAVPFTLIAWGETRLGSIPAGIWNATTPLLTMLTMLVLLPGDRPDARRVSGLLVGLAGVLLVLAPWQGLGGGELAGHLAFFAAASCYAVGTPYSQRFLIPRIDSIAVVSVMHLGCAAVMMLVAMGSLEGVPTSVPSLPVLAAMAILGMLGTGAAYLLFNALVRDAGSPTAASVTYLIPVVATVLGVLVLHEPIGWQEPVGMLVVLTGVWLVTGRRQAPR